MSKNKSVALFDLIKSLSKAEKRFITLQLSGSSRESLFFLLFKHLCNQDQYDEQAILQLNNQVKSSQLPNIKKYLYDNILNSLIVFHKEVEIEDKVDAFIKKSDQLVKKNLLQQAEVQLERGWELCVQYDLYLHKLMVISRRQKLQILNIDSRGGRLQTDKEIAESKNLHHEKLNAVEQLNSIYGLEYLRNQVFIQLRNERFNRKSFGIVDGKPLEEHTEFSLEKPAGGFHASYLQHITLAIYYITLGRHKRSYVYFKKAIALIEKNFHFTNYEPRLYATTLYNFILNCARLNKFDTEYGLALEKLKREVEKGRFDKVSTSCMELIWYSSRGAFSEGVKAADAISKHFSSENPKCSFIMEMDLYFDLMYIYFGCGLYNEALAWVNKIIYSEAEKKIIDLYSIARLMQLIIHYELGNTAILESLIKSGRRFLTTRERIYQFENLLLDYLNNLIKADSKKVKSGLHKTFYTQLLELEKDPVEKRVFEFIEFTSWVESKLNGHNFEQLVQQKYNLLQS